MPNRSIVADHYANGSLLELILEGLHKLGKTTKTATFEDLGPVDEFHIGGRQATEAFLDQLDISATHRVFDVGCGLGGGCRFAAHRYGCHVTGMDLTPDYVDTGNTLSEWVGMRELVELEVGDATAHSHASASYDRAFVMHVGMNIRDKHRLAAELFRILKPGGVLGIYDIMRMNEGELMFPVPWATTPESSILGTPDEYETALETAGFRVTAERNRGAFSLDFFSSMQAKAASSGGPAPLGIHLLMGENAPHKIINMIDNIKNGLIAPVEIIAEKPSN